MKDYATFRSLATGPTSDQLAVQFLDGALVPSAVFRPRGIRVEAWVTQTEKAVVVHAKSIDLLHGATVRAVVRVAPVQVTRNRLGRAIERAVFKVVRAMSGTTQVEG